MSKLGKEIKRREIKFDDARFENTRFRNSYLAEKLRDNERERVNKLREKLNGK